VDNMEETWAYPQPFDYIFCRYMTMALKDFPKVTRQAFA